MARKKCPETVYQEKKHFQVPASYCKFFGAQSLGQNHPECILASHGYIEEAITIKLSFDNDFVIY
jgi:hypothetical protein